MWEQIFAEDTSVARTAKPVPAASRSEEAVIEASTDGYAIEFVRDEPPDRFKSPEEYEAWKRELDRLHAEAQRGLWDRFWRYVDRRFLKPSDPRYLRTGARTRESRNRRGVRQLALAGAH